MLRRWLNSSVFSTLPATKHLGRKTREEQDGKPQGYCVARQVP